VQGKRYRFVEYSVTVVSANEATQRIDVYYN